jgi:hypothetical protein
MTADELLTEAIRLLMTHERRAIEQAVDLIRQAQEALR